MSKVSLIILVLNLLFSIYTIAQSDNIAGYIITQNNDTIYGKIDNRNYYDNSQFCDFSDERDNSKKRYYPNELFGYRFIDGKYYVSREIRGQKIFLEYLINGKLDIYFYQDDNKFNHYYISKDSLPLREITYSKGIKEIEGTQMFYESKPYIGLLTYYTSDCDSVKEKISQLGEPNHKNLIKFAKKYHDFTCFDENCIIYEKKIPRKIKFNIYGGSNMLFSYYTNSKLKFNPSCGFNISFQQSQKHERLFYGLGFFYEGKIDSAHDFFRFPISIYYLNQNPGLKPIISYQFNIYPLGSQAIDLGIKYQMKKISMTVSVEIMTALFVIPYGTGLHFGVTYDLR